MTNLDQPAYPSGPASQPAQAGDGYRAPYPSEPAPLPVAAFNGQMTPYSPQPTGYPQAYYPPQVPVIRKQGAWGLWWLCVITFGIYYFIWYDRINRELSAVLRRDVPGDGQWWCQLIPVYNLVGLARTAKRVNDAHAAVGSPTRVGVFTAWFWAPGWFASQTRYLQRRINILHDVLASHSVRGPGF